jgi:hypothetical protein
VIHKHIRVYKILARFVLTYDIEAWTIYKRQESKVTTVGMKFMRRKAGDNLIDHRRNTDIMKEQNTGPIMITFTQTYRIN